MGPTPQETPSALQRATQALDEDRRYGDAILASKRPGKLLIVRRTEDGGRSVLMGGMYPRLGAPYAPPPEVVQALGPWYEGLPFEAKLLTYQAPPRLLEGVDAEDEQKLAERMRLAYAIAHHHYTREVYRGGVTAKNRAKLAAAARELIERRREPLAWCMWAWHDLARGGQTKPRMSTICSVTRIASRWEEFAREGHRFYPGGKIYRPMAQAGEASARVESLRRRVRQNLAHRKPLTREDALAYLDDIAGPAEERDALMTACKEELLAARLKDRQGIKRGLWIWRPPTRATAQSESHR